MAMKQTQTKLFDFSDVGLDFCAGSKNLFPDRFKKMLALGYNEQTVSSVAVAGNQVTFTYGGTHGYVADRVLKVNAPELLSINDGEFVIDSVTTNTVTMTIDGAPASIAGNFTTNVASLGWEIVYEQAHIHIYKFKHIDDTDMYARLCFQSATTAARPSAVVAIGNAVDLDLGVITSDSFYGDTGNCLTVSSTGSGLRWEFSGYTDRSRDNFTYSQGYSTFGLGRVVGSIYHLAVLCNAASNQSDGRVNAIIPFSSEYELLNYPALLANWSIATTSTTLGISSLSIYRIYIGKIRCSASIGSDTLDHSVAASSYLPSEIDGFDTTTLRPLLIYTNAEKQFIGVLEDVYQAMYANATAPSVSSGTMPNLTKTTDLLTDVVTHHVSNGTTQRAWLSFPIERVK